MPLARPPKSSFRRMLRWLLLLMLAGKLSACSASDQGPLVKGSLQMGEVRVEQLGGFAGFGGPHLKSWGVVNLSSLSQADRVAGVSKHLVNVGVAVAAEQNRVLRASAAVVDDPLYPDQWAFSRIGAEPAWLRVRSLGVGGAGVIVAVVDTGIHTAHPDLAGHIWDDGAGHHGWNLINFNFDVSDADGHGTELAGTIGAVSNNTLGI